MQLVTKKTLLLSTLMLILAGILSNVPAVQAQDEKPEDLLDHFKVYRFDPPANLGVPVTLTDQWGSENHIVQTLEKFSPNVSKNGSVVLDPTAHLSWWTISGDGTDPVRAIKVTHQFGEYGLMVRQPRYLLAPAIKNQVPGGPAGSTVVGLNHFKCYDAVGPSLGVTLSLMTQFGVESVVVEDLLYFCNPTEKTRNDDGSHYPIGDTEAHLTCYDIGPIQPGASSLVFSDQFIQWQGSIFENELLCIPSFKENVVPNEDKSWGELKSIYR